MPEDTQDAALPKATLRDTIGIVVDVLGPAIAKGDIIRRPRMVALAERLELDRRAVRRLQRLRNKYGTGPLLLRLPGRSQAVILAPEHVHRVLTESPEPFATASSEKRSSLSHFEPQGVLISHGAERVDRRRYNERVLDSEDPMHRLGERFRFVVGEEAELLMNAACRRGQLTWGEFANAWFRVVRRVVFGDGARDDHALTDMMAQLRSDANWAFLRPRRDILRKRFFARMEGYLDRAEPGSLASIMAHTPTTQKTAPAHQVPQWLFGFDPACMAAYRALALLASHPEQASHARDEIRRSGTPGPLSLPYLRACVLESLRLWPTTPMILRQSTTETAWETATMPARTGILIFAPFFHRDDERLPYADRFSPELWLEERSPAEWPLIPFSGGPANCPGRNLVLLLTSTLLARLLVHRNLQLNPAGRLDPRNPLPATLDNYSLRFDLDD